MNKSISTKYWIWKNKKRLLKSIEELTGYMMFLKFKQENDPMAEFKSSSVGGISCTKYKKLKHFSKVIKYEGKSKYRFGTGEYVAKENVIFAYQDLILLSRFKGQNLLEQKHLDHYLKLLNDQVNLIEKQIDDEIISFVNFYKKDKNINITLETHFKKDFDLLNFEEEYNKKLNSLKYFYNHYYKKYVSEKDFFNKKNLLNIRNFNDMKITIEKRIREHSIKLIQESKNDIYLSNKKEEKNIKSNDLEKDDKPYKYESSNSTDNDNFSQQMLNITIMGSAVG